MNDLLPLKEAIYEVGLLFSRVSQPSEAEINAYAKALQRYTPTQVTHAFNQVILSGGAHFPSLAEILTHLRPKEVSSDDIGNFVANEVIQKVISFGSYRLREAYESLSDVSKKTIGQNTYILMEICNSEQDQIPTIRAQIRGMAKAAAEAHKANIKNEKLEQIGIKNANVFSITSGKMMSLDYSDFDPEAS